MKYEHVEFVRVDLEHYVEGFAYDVVSRHASRVGTVFNTLPPTFTTTVAHVTLPQLREITHFMEALEE